MTEKRRPHHDLDAFKDAFCVRRVARITMSATKDAFALGCDLANVRDVVLSMQRTHFYKSMTSLHDHTNWQDVYHVPSEVGLLYVKFTDDQVTEFKLLSFKER